MGDGWGTLGHYYGISSEQLREQSAASSESPRSRYVAGPHPAGDTASTTASFTEWRVSPVFWLAVFAVFALGMIHLEGAVRARVG